MAAVQYREFFGSANAAETLVFSVFARADTGVAIAPAPTISASPSGGGWFTFDYDWATAPAGVTAIQWSVVPPNGGDFYGLITPSSSSTGTTYVPPAPGTPSPGQFTLSELRLRAKERADMVNSSFVSTDEWTRFLNASYAELYSLLVEKSGENYYAPEKYQFTTNGTAETYPLPDGTTAYLDPDGATARPFFKLVGVDMQVSGTPNAWVSLKPFPMAERNSFGLYGGSGIPQSGMVIQVLYAPRLTPLVNEADLVDGVAGWEELIVVDAARKALLKEESDASALTQEKRDIVARIEHEAASRDVGEPPVVADVQRGGIDLPDYSEIVHRPRYRLAKNALWLRSPGYPA